MFATRMPSQRRRGAIDRSGSARRPCPPLSCSLPLTGRAGEGCMLAGQVLLLRLASGISSAGEAPETARGRGVGSGLVLVCSRICKNSESGGKSSEFSQTRLRRAAGPADSLKPPACTVDRCPSSRWFDNRHVLSIVRHPVMGGKHQRGAGHIANPLRSGDMTSPGLSTRDAPVARP